MQINEFDYQSLDALFGDYKERAQKLLNEKIEDQVEILGDLLESSFFAGSKTDLNIGKGQGKRIIRLFFTSRDT